MATKNTRKQTAVERQAAKVGKEIRTLAIMVIESQDITDWEYLAGIRKCADFYLVARAAYEAATLTSLKENSGNVSQTDNGGITGNGGKSNGGSELRKSSGRKIRQSGGIVGTADNSNGGKRTTRQKREGTIQPGKIGGNSKTRKV